MAHANSGSQMDTVSVEPSMRLSPAEHRRLRRQARTRRELTAWMFVGPQFLFFAVFLLLPVIGVVFWSTQSGSISDPSTTFVGLDNFANLPTQVEAVSAIQNTFGFALMSIPLTLILALGIAMLLTRVKRGAVVYRFLIYFPVLIPGVVAALIWVFLTNVDFGLFDIILKTFHVAPVTWLGQTFALPILAALDIWRSVGYWAIFFLAAVVGLPAELYHAASLDGAGAWQRFRFLTLPLLRRVILFAVVVSTIFGLQIFDTPFILTRGGPGTATTTIVYIIQTYVFGVGDKVGFAAAISLALLASIVVLTGIQAWALRERRGAKS